MHRVTLAVCVFSALLVGCTHSANDARGSSADPATQPAAAADVCTPSPTIESRAPENTEGGAAGPDVYPWYVNAYPRIWMRAQPFVAGERYKVAWFRPAGSELQITGRRLDSQAPPMYVDITPRAYRHQFCPSIMTFPTAGCWEVVAKSNESELRFVTKVAAKSADGEKVNR